MLDDPLLIKSHLCHRSVERRKNEEAIAARLSPQSETDSAKRRDRASHHRIQVTLLDFNIIFSNSLWKT